MSLGKQIISDNGNGNQSMEQGCALKATISVLTGNVNDALTQKGKRKCWLYDLENGIIKLLRCFYTQGFLETDVSGHRCALRSFGI